MLLAIYKEILEVFEDKFQTFLEYKADQYPEVFSFDWNRLKEEVKSIEDALIWDYDLRNVVLAVVVELLQLLHEDGFLDFYDFVQATNKILGERYIMYKLYDYMHEVKVTKDALDSIFIKPC